MMRRAAIALAATAVLILGSAGQVLAHPPGPGTHLHCLTTPSGKTHPLARGVTLRAPHDPAFHNLHGNVHLGAFSGHPLAPLSVDLTEPYACPTP